MPSLVEKIVTLHNQLKLARLPHAFGGALALAWCTREPRGTSDVDINVFVADSDAQVVIEALRPNVVATARDLETLARDGQIRLWWDVTPVDLFLNNTPFHDDVALRIRHQEFAGTPMPFLSCDDLAVFKVFFNRSKDWTDIEAMLDADALRVGRLVDMLHELLGGDDSRVQRMRQLADQRR